MQIDTFKLSYTFLEKRKPFVISDVIYSKVLAINLCDLIHLIASSNFAYY